MKVLARYRKRADSTSIHTGNTTAFGAMSINLINYFNKISAVWKVSQETPPCLKIKVILKHN